MSDTRAMMLQLEQKSLSLVEAALTIRVIDQPSYDAAVEKRRALKQWEAEVNGVFEPIRERTHAAWQEVLRQEKTVLRGHPEALRHVDNQINIFEARKVAEEQAEQARLAAEHRLTEEQARLNTAIAAEQAGADPSTIDRILSEPAAATLPPAPVPTFTRPAGFGHRGVWDVEVTDAWELVRAIAKDKSRLRFIAGFNLAELRREAARLAGSPLPGVRGFKKPVNVDRAK